MLYIVRRTLYLHDDLWAAAHSRARREDTTISDLVRQEVRERYLGSLTARKAAMQAVVGIWTDGTDIGNTKAYAADSAAEPGSSGWPTNDR